MIKLGVKDFGDFIFNIAFDFNRQRWRLSLIWNVIQSKWFQHRNMVNGVNTMHGVRKS